MKTFSDLREWRELVQPTRPRRNRGRTEHLTHGAQMNLRAIPLLERRQRGPPGDAASVSSRRGAVTCSDGKQSCGCRGRGPRARGLLRAMDVFAVGIAAMVSQACASVKLIRQHPGNSAVSRTSATPQRVCDKRTQGSAQGRTVGSQGLRELALTGVQR